MNDNEEAHIRHVDYDPIDVFTRQLPPLPFPPASIDQRTMITDRDDQKEKCILGRPHNQLMHAVNC